MAASLLLGLTACSDGGGKKGPQTGVPDLEANLEFTATIEGRVTDGESGEPLEGITVELSALGVEVEDAEEPEEEAAEEETAADAGAEEITSIAATPAALRKARTGISTTTDENGEWQLNINTPGEHTLVQHGTAGNGSEYARTSQSLTIDPADYLNDSAEGQYVIGVTANRSMFRKEGTVAATVFGSNKRDVIAGARVVIRYGSNIEDPSLPNETTTDDDGKFELMNMPVGTSINMQVRPVDRDEDGILDTQNYSENVVAYATGTTETFIGPVGALVNPRLLWTNADSMRTWPVEPTFEFIFSHPMDTSASSADLTMTNSDGRTIALVPTWVDDFTLEVTPAAPLLPGMPFSLSGYAYSLDPTNIYLGNYNIRTEGGADDQPTPTMPVLLNDPTNIGFYQNNFRIGVEPLENIDLFLVYARTGADRDWVLVDSATPNGFSPYQEISVNFDSNEVDDVSSPRGSGSLFSHGGPLYIAVAVRVDGVEGPLSPSLEIERRQCLSGVAVYAGTEGSDAARNTDMGESKPLVIALQATGEEWLPQDFSPTISFTSSSLVTNPLDGDDFEMARPNPWTIEWRAMLAPETDSQFLEYDVDVAGIMDVTGRTLCDPDSVETNRLVPTDGVFDDYRWAFEGSAQDWTATGDWARGEDASPVTSPDSAPRGDDSPTFFGTGMSAARTDAVTSVLTSPTFLTPDQSFGIYFRYWHDPYYDGVSAYDTFSAVFVDEDDGNTEYLMEEETSGTFGWSGGTYSVFPPNLPTHGHIEFRYEALDSSGAAVVGGAFVDDVTVLGDTNADASCPEVGDCSWL